MLNYSQRFVPHTAGHLPHVTLLVCHQMCVPVLTGKLFIWFLATTDKTHAAISCGEKTNLSDAVNLALWPLSLIPQGCICMRTDRGRRFPLGLPPLCSGKLLQWLWSPGKNTSRSNAGVTVWSLCQLPDSPAHFLTTKNGPSPLATIETCLFMCVFNSVGHISIDS